MIAEKLRPGDAIGLVSPSKLVLKETFAPTLEALQALGFRIKLSNNFYANGWEYAASDAERAADINQMICDDEVKLIFFSGGEGSDDVLPLIDYEAAKRHPKRWLSYSDGTSILTTVWQRTGIVTYYGQAPRTIRIGGSYERKQFQRFICGDTPAAHAPNSPWRCLTPGVTRGTLVGGYMLNFVHLQGWGQLLPQPGEDYILFIEDHEKFNNIEAESAWIGRLERCPFMKQARGLLFGHYSDTLNEQLLQRLQLLGKRRGIPVIYCDDFGHCGSQAILPIGVQAELDANQGALRYPKD